MKKDKVKNKKYKFRAEFVKDVLKLRELSRGMRLSKLNLTFSDIFPDVKATFESSASIKDLEMLFHSIEDGHVMIETLNTEKNYNGERTYTNKSWLLSYNYINPKK
jgi:hypothetical protein